MHDCTGQQIPFMEMLENRTLLSASAICQIEGTFESYDYHRPNGGGIELDANATHYGTKPTYDMGDYYLVSGEQLPLLRRVGEVIIGFSEGQDAETRIAELMAEGNLLASFDNYNPYFQGSYYFKSSQDMTIEQTETVIDALQEIDGIAWYSPVFNSPESNLRVIVTREIIIKLNPGVTVEDIFSEGMKTYHRLRGTTDQFVVTVTEKSGVDVLKLTQTLEEDSRIEWASPNFISEISIGPPEVPDIGGTINPRVTNGDTNNDGKVNYLDLYELGKNFGKFGDYTQGDCNGDFKVSLLDLDILGQNYETSEVPVVSVDELATNDPRPQLTGIVEHKQASVVVTVNGKSYPATNNQDGTWTLPDDTITDELAEGVYDVVVSAEMPSGYIGTDEAADELTIDLTGPTVSIVEIDPDPATEPVHNIVVVFDEPVTGLDISDMTLKRNGVEISLADMSIETFSYDRWYLVGLYPYSFEELTDTDGDYEVILSAAGSGITDIAGNPLIVGTSEMWTMQTPVS